MSVPTETSGSEDDKKTTHDADQKERAYTFRKVLNDPIHGHIELHPLLCKIIDTPQFQRLRYIKQLGGCYFVYPGASHNRFEHSIGVGYLAGELAKSLRTHQDELDITDRDILCVQIAGLCHDLGHGPLSHMFEKFVSKACEEKWKHERASLKMFDKLVSNEVIQQTMKEHDLVLEEDLIFIKELIKGEPLESKDLEGISGHDKHLFEKCIPKESHSNPRTWQFKGRPEDKSFLYDIVSNKQSGIDVDKFDYFARDSYHLGMQNNFDYRRFLKFARVYEGPRCTKKEQHDKCDSQCQVKRKQICTRDKEVHNLYDMFYTRSYLHNRAYQHPVTRIIENMITKAFLKADKHIQIEGSRGKKFTLSTAINDMEAYTKLTDSVFEQILNSSSKELAEARQILEDIVHRRLPKYLGRVKLSKEKSMENIEKWKNELAALTQAELKPEDFEVLDIFVDYGMKDKNPIKNVCFYNKDCHKISQISEHEVSNLIPKVFLDQWINVYCNKTDGKSLETAKRMFGEWCKKFQDQVP